MAERRLSTLLSEEWFLGTTLRTPAEIPGYAFSLKICSTRSFPSFSLVPLQLSKRLAFASAPPASRTTVVLPTCASPTRSLAAEFTGSSVLRLFSSVQMLQSVFRS